MIFLSLFFSWHVEAADLTLQGKVLSLNANPDKNNYFVKFDNFSLPLEVDKGDLYRCVREALNSQERVVFSFDSRLNKVRSCK